MYDVKESDWKKFKEHLPNWQEDFMNKLNKEYIEILSRNENPSNNFWTLEKRIYKDKKKTGVLAEVKRSKMVENILNLISDGAILFEDLKDFSDELKEEIQIYLNR